MHSGPLTKAGSTNALGSLCAMCCCKKDWENDGASSYISPPARWRQFHTTTYCQLSTGSPPLGQYSTMNSRSSRLNVMLMFLP